MRYKLVMLALVSLHLQLVVLAQVTRVDAVGFTVSDMERSVRFYEDMLGFKKVSDKEVFGNGYEQLQGVFALRMRIVRLQLGDEFIELTDYLTSGGRSIPEDAKSNDLIFQHIAIVVSDMEKAYELLHKRGISHVSTSPQTIPLSNSAAAGVKAFYFQDPDRHNLELIYFPKGKGQVKWQGRTGKLFLGIDHTAIGISNTDSSLTFYQDILGIERKGDSWNNGTEQEHLNSVEGASLHITGLRAAGGPGIEFLEYLKPGRGKTYPADTRADDIWHWQTILLTSNAASLYDRLRNSRYHIISKDLISLETVSGKRCKAFIVRDADGHAMLIMEYME